MFRIGVKIVLNKYYWFQSSICTHLYDGRKKTSRSRGYVTALLLKANNVVPIKLSKTRKRAPDKIPTSVCVYSWLVNGILKNNFILSQFSPVVKKTSVADVDTFRETLDADPAWPINIEAVVEIPIVKISAVDDVFIASLDSTVKCNPRSSPIPITVPISWGMVSPKFWRSTRTEVLKQIVNQMEWLLLIWSWVIPSC